MIPYYFQFAKATAVLSGHPRSIPVREHLYKHNLWLPIIYQNVLRIATTCPWYSAYIGLPVHRVRGLCPLIADRVNRYFAPFGRTAAAPLRVFHSPCSGSGHTPARHSPRLVIVCPDPSRRLFPAVSFRSFYAQLYHSCFETFLSCVLIVFIISYSSYKIVFILLLWYNFIE